MARAFSRTAGKDYPEHDIKKGETYYYWSVGFRGPKQMSKTYPRPSQLTGSKLSGALAAAEAAEDTINSCGDIDEIAEALNEAASSIREVAEEYQEAADATTGNGNRVPNADEMEEKAQGLNDWADALEADASDIESMSASDFEGDDEIDALPEELVVTENQGTPEDPDSVKRRRDIESFDDLTDDEKDNMLQAARETALANIGCPL